MKILIISALILLNGVFLESTAQPGKSDTSAQSAAKHLFIDVHELQPGKVKTEDVAVAHKKDLATQYKYDVNFLKYWVDENKGVVYCLSSAPDTGSIIKTHAEAHGLLPAHIYEVTDGEAAQLKNSDNLFLDIHYLGAGNVTAKDVEAAHKKDLATQARFGVNFINYWVNEKQGVVVCLSEAKNSDSVIQTHKNAHGLLPDVILKVKQGE